MDWRANSEKTEKKLPITHGELVFLDSIKSHINIYATISKISRYVICWSCGQSPSYLLYMWPWLNCLWNIFFLQFSVSLLKTCKLLVRMKTQWNCSVCAEVNMVYPNGPCKHSKVTVHRQSQTMEIEKSCGGKKPIAINRFDHTTRCVGFKSLSIPAFLFSLWKCGVNPLSWYFYLF